MGVLIIGILVYLFFSRAPIFVEIYIYISLLRWNFLEGPHLDAFGKKSMNVRLGGLG